MIKLKPDVMNLLLPLLMAGEQVEAAAAYGHASYSPDKKIHLKDRDYLLITDRRLICVKGEWFETRQGVTSYPRGLITNVDVANFLLGCTMTITIKPPNGEPRQLLFHNCGKLEGDAIKNMFLHKETDRICPDCGSPLHSEFTFCPFCKTALKRQCSSCGKPMEHDWKVCPFCGK